jgi:ATP-dependent Clp protease ATP-binding subunit ClpB
LQRAAELRYGSIPDLSDRLQEAESKAKSTELVQEEVRENDIAQVVASWTGIPVARLMQGEAERLLQLESRLHQRVIGQELPVRALADAMRRSRTGLADPSRPAGVFLFLGPTGVGKTELAKTLAETMFDSEEAMIRLDMSEYMEKHTVSRLVGSPPGYVGYDEGGQLSEAVRRRPYSVVLLDEIEKAHGDVVNILLQIFDDGRLTDGRGRLISFRNTILIMTSNIPGGLGGAEEHFRPELINRIDDILEFHPLGQEHLNQIIDLQLIEVNQRLEGRDIQLALDEGAKQALIDWGNDSRYGARTLRRAIQTHLVNPLARWLLENSAKGTIYVEREGDELVFQLPPTFEEIFGEN